MIKWEIKSNVEMLYEISYRLMTDSMKTWESKNNFSHCTVATRISNQAGPIEADDKSPVLPNVSIAPGQPYSVYTYENDQMAKDAIDAEQSVCC